VADYQDGPNPKPWPTIVLDVDTGELFYDPTADARRGSVKFGPLRTMQMFLAYQILKFIQAHGGTGSFPQNIPTNTVDKIAAMLDAGTLKLSPRDAQELTDLYKYFLWCFYLSEYRYSQNGEEKTIAVPNVQLFRENLANVLKLVTLEQS